jgi:hypothetical protein
MKFLSDGKIAYKSIYDTYTQYVIFKPDGNKYDDGFLYGPGIEVTINHPTSSYIYTNDYKVGDSGWDKLFNSAQFNNGYGKCNGVGVENNQLILFNLFQKYSIWRNVHAQNYYQKYVACMIGITYLDMIYRYGSKTVVDPSLSNAVMPLINGFHKTGLGPAPERIKQNTRDKEFDYSKYVVKVDPKIAVQIPDNFLYFGHNGFKYEMSRLSKDPVDLESPRWWRQVEIKSLDVSDIICDNQLLLF